MTAISSLVNDIFRSYDRNGDSCIAVRPGHGYEGSHTEREHQTSFDQDTITVTRYSHDKLFRAADKDGNGQVCRQELADAIKFFDSNKDGRLENQGPFWNRKGELRNFEKAYPERAELLEHHVIPHPHPYPNYPNYPHNPGYPHNGYPHGSHPHYGRDDHHATGFSVGIRIGG